MGVFPKLSYTLDLENPFPICRCLTFFYLSYNANSHSRSLLHYDADDLFVKSLQRLFYRTLNICIAACVVKAHSWFTILARFYFAVVPSEEADIPPPLDDNKLVRSFEAIFLHHNYYI